MIYDDAATSQLKIYHKKGADAMKKSYRYNQFTSIFIFSLMLLVAYKSPAGPQGPPGERGPQGEDGNANIMYSDWMDMEWDEASTNVTKQLVIPESRITERFLNDGGIVLMFMRLEVNTGGMLIYSLPHISGNFHYRFITSAVQDIGGITFALISIDGTTAIPDYLWEDHQIRYVLVPGSVNLRAKGLDWQDYEQVVQLLRHSGLTIQSHDSCAPR